LLFCLTNKSDFPNVNWYITGRAIFLPTFDSKLLLLTAFEINDFTLLWQHWSHDITSFSLRIFSMWNIQHVLNNVYLIIQFILFIFKIPFHKVIIQFQFLFKFQNTKFVYYYNQCFFTIIAFTLIHVHVC
jgi:hypothetical protein